MKHSSLKQAISAVLCTIVLMVSATTPGRASIRLSNAWLDSDTNGKMFEVPESSRAGDVADIMAKSLNAAPTSGFEGEHGFILFVDDVKYYIEPEKFMVKSQPDEVCTPQDYKGFPTYKCDEGQRHTNDCHLAFVSDKFEAAGIYRIIINEPFKTWCNAVPGIGTANKATNELLVTVQYFSIETKPANNVADVGGSWQRMTLLFKVKAVDGKIELTPDTTCLKNPNTIDSIPDARKKLKQCQITHK